MPDQEGHNPTPPNPNPLAPHGPLPGSSISRERNAAGRAFQPASAASSDATTIQPPTPITEAAGSRIGPYKLLQRIGEGGFGVVFLAQQDAPVRRKIALKIIKLGMDSRQVIARFEAERQALALMDHPHIARVIDGGTTAPSSPGGGRPYFVMEYVVGDSVIAFADAHRLDITARLDLFSQVCQAVQHAHQKGIIHRDLKPGNILASMVDGKPFARVIDFGIAKATGAAGGSLTDKTLFTEHRQLMGTPEYMSPEQAEGSPDIDTRTDIYALGVLLYELLTGLTPFDGARLRSAAWGEMQRIIREEEPLAPSLRLSRSLPTVAAAAAARHTEPGALAGRVRGELDWIVLKAIDKDRARRYETANQFAADVQRHLAGEAVVAAPPSAGYRVRKFVRKHKTLVIGTSAVAATLLVGIAGTTWQGYRAHTESRAAKQAKTEAEAHAASEREARLLADAKTAEAEAARAEVEAKSRTIEYDSYVANVQMAQAAMDNRQFDRLRQRLDACPERLRGWEWKWLNARSDGSLTTLTGHSGEVSAVAFSPDGTKVVTASEDNTARVWDVATGATLAELKGHAGSLTCAAFSPDGTRVITASWDDTARVWDAATGNSLAELKGHKGVIGVSMRGPNGAETSRGPVSAAVFSPDGRRIATASSDKTARLWDATTGESLVEFKGHTQAVTSVAFSPDGTRIATASTDNTARVWDAATGTSLAEFKGHTNWVFSAMFSPDGTRIVTASSDKTARVWDVATSQTLWECKGHTSSVVGASFSPDGRWIVTASGDNTVRVWDATWRLRPDGAFQRLSSDNTARVWDAIASRELTEFDDLPSTSRAELKGHTGMIVSASFSVDGTRVVTASSDATSRVWDGATGSPSGELRGHTQCVTAAAFSPDGSRIATASQDHTARLWDSAAMTGVTPLRGHTRHVINSASFSPDSKQIVTASDDGTARVWDVTTGATIVELKGKGNHVLVALFRPDAKQIVTASDDGTSQVWDAATGAALAELKGHTSSVYNPAFSADGARVATTSNDNTARVWDTATGATLAELKGHTDSVRSVAFSPDGTRIVTASSDFSARVWDARTGASLAELQGHTNALTSAAFSPDGTRIVTTSYDHTARVWDAATGASLSELKG